MRSESPKRYMMILERQAERALRRLPPDVLHRVDALILGLAVDPCPSDCKKLKGFEIPYSLRLGDWRIIYAIEDDQLVVLVIEIAPRGQAQRNP